MPDDVNPDDPSAELLARLEAWQREVAEAPWIGNPCYAPLGTALSAFAPEPTIAALAGLMTVPRYQTASIRLELLIHLAALHCRGKKKPTDKIIRRWVNKTLAALPLRRVEDPPEDVFVSNVMAGSANYRLFDGTWEGNDYYLQHVLDCIGRTRWGQPFFRLRARMGALLQLSDTVAERAGLERWATTDQEDPDDEILSANLDARRLARRVTFTFTEIEAIGVTLEALEPFTFAPARRSALADESVFASTLIRHPVAVFDNTVVLAVPTAVSAAIRHYVLDWVEENTCVAEFTRCLEVRQIEAAMESTALRVDAPPHIATPTPVPLEVAQIPACIVAESIVPFDTDKLAHLVLLRDSLSDTRENGLASIGRLAVDDEVALGHHLSAITQQLQSAAPGGGLTIVVQGGLGRVTAHDLPPALPPWHRISISLADFELFASCDEANLLRMWKLHDQLEVVAEGGCEFQNLSGELNLYAYWQQTSFLLTPPSIPYPSPHLELAIGPNHLYALRREERHEQDVHVSVFDPQRRAAKVRRLHIHPFFAALSNRRIYASEEFARIGKLVGVVESSATILWTELERPTAGEAVRSFAHDIWDATLTWMDRLLPELHRSPRWSDGRPDVPIRVRLSLEDEPAWNNFADLKDSQAPERPWTAIDSTDRTIDVHLPFGFCALLHRATNDGERALLEELVVALLAVGRPTESSIADVAHDRAAAELLVRDCMRGTAARALHVFAARHAADFLAPVRPPPARLIQRENSAAWARGLAWRVVPQPNAPHHDPSGIALTIVGEKACGGFLHKAVDRLWKAIKEDLGQLSLSSLVEMLIDNVESILWDRQHWRRTARAIDGLHGPYEDVATVAARRESDRALAAHASRVLIEMAICTCPLTGGRAASLATVDRLLAAVALIVELASDSDAIRGGFSNAAVQVYQNGAVACDEEFLRSVVVRYGLGSHVSDFRGAIGSYDALFAAKDGQATNQDSGDTADAGFNEAFLAEFEITPDRFFTGLAELLDLAHEKQSWRISTTRAEIMERLLRRRQFTAEESEAFTRMLSLVPRPRWDETPAEYEARDWYPWRFRRRLSVVARPLVCFGADDTAVCVYGVQQLGASASYLFGAIRGAWMPDKYFRSASMQSFWGATADALGHAFNRDVAEHLENEEFRVHLEVQMRTLGAPAELGDLDVVAWRPGHPNVWLIECKRLLPARTVGEIVDRLNQFRGESGDQLSKHLRRVEWVRRNAAQVATALGLPDGAAFTPILTTNIAVPMQFVSDTLLPSSQITTREQLLETLRRLAAEQ